MKPWINSSRLRLEQLEDRCLPGTVLDVLADPLLVGFSDGDAQVLLASSPSLSLLLADHQAGAAPSQASGPAHGANPSAPAPTEAVLTVANMPQTHSTPEMAGNFVSAFARDAQGVRVIWGESAIIDGARVATWALVSPHDNTILAVGATFSLKLAEHMPEPGSGPAGAIASLDYPTLVPDTTFFNHLEMQSNLHGHDTPRGSINPIRNSVPHFDFHFYSIPEEQVWAIPGALPPLPPVAADRLPPGYIQPGPSILEMGRHSAPAWSLTDPDFLSTIMIAGYLPDGSQMHFLEPMITPEVLLARQDFTLPVPMPSVLGRDTLYPTNFQATFQGNAYSFAFSDFVSMH